MIRKLLNRWHIDQSKAKWLSEVVSHPNFAEVRALILSEAVAGGNADFSNGVLSTFEGLTSYSESRKEEGDDKPRPKPFEHVVQEESSFTTKS